MCIRDSVYLGLVVQHEFLRTQGPADVFHAFVVVANAAIKLGIKNVITIFPGQLGLIHGLIRLAQQLIGVDGVLLRVERQAQAGRDLQ